MRDDVVRVMAVVEDLNFMRGDGFAGTPKGLRNWDIAANVTATNGTTATQIETDFKDLLQALEGSNVPMLRPAWVMNSRSKNHLFTLRDANGALIFPEIRLPQPTVYSFPVLLSTQVPITQGAGTATEVMLVDFSQVILGEVDSIEVDVSRETAYVDSEGTMRSAWSRNQTVVRAILRHDLGVKHPEAIAVKTGVTWGA